MNTKLRHALVAALGLMFLASGAAFLAGQMNEQMAMLGVPSWAIPVIGAIKVAATAAMIVPASRFYGAAVLTGTMAGAFLTHLINADFAGAPPSLVLGILAGLVAWFHRPVWVNEKVLRRTVA